MHATDHELLARWTGRADSEAFSELVARHGRMVLGVCRRVFGDVQLADDVAQECSLRLADEQGRTTILGNAGSVRVYVARERSQETHAGHLLSRLRSHGAIPPEYVDLGEILLPTGPANDLVLRLPEAWLRPPD